MPIEAPIKTTIPGVAAIDPVECPYIGILQMAVDAETYLRHGGPIKVLFTLVNFAESKTGTVLDPASRRTVMIDDLFDADVQKEIPEAMVIFGAIVQLLPRIEAAIATVNQLRADRAQAEQLAAEETARAAREAAAAAEAKRLADEAAAAEAASLAGIGEAPQ